MEGRPIASVGSDYDCKNTNYSAQKKQNSNTYQIFYSLKG